MEEKIEMQTQEGLTFGEIFRLLKKGWVMLVVCLLIGLILATSVMVVLRELIGTTSYETEITFSSSSISDKEGFNPSTTVNTLIKSDKVVYTALANLDYSAEDQKALMDKGLISNLSAYANESKKDSTGVAYPYKVTLSLKKTGSRALSKAQSSALIEEITKQVILELVEAYKCEISFDEVTAIDFTQYNYLQAYDKVDNAMDGVNAFKNSLCKDALDYSTNGKSIKALLEKYDSVENELNVLKQKLVSNIIVNPDALSTELDYATYQANYYTQKATQLETRITDYAQLLKDTKPDITIMTGGATIEALNKYYELVDVYNELQDEYALVSAKATEWTAIKTAYTGSTTTEETVKTQYNTIIASYNSAYAEIKEVIDAYNADNYVSTLVGETKSVETVKDSAISSIIIVLVDVVVVAVIMVIVVAVEKKKDAKKAKTENK